MSRSAVGTTTIAGPFRITTRFSQFHTTSTGYRLIYLRAGGLGFVLLDRELRVKAIEERVRDREHESVNGLATIPTDDGWAFVRLIPFDRPPPRWELVFVGDDIANPDGSFPAAAIVREGNAYYVAYACQTGMFFGQVECRE